MSAFARLTASLLLCVSLASAACASPASDQHARKRVAIVLFDGVEIIDYSGPYEVFGAADYDVYTVGRTTAPVTTAMGLRVTPKYDFAHAPEPDLVVVPGGDVRGPRADQQTLTYLRTEAARAQHIMSVCNGAVILADAGLLDGLEATATYRWIPRMRAQYPKIHMVSDRRFVDNGKIITTAGLSAGIDGALHMVEVMDGPGTAQSVALGIEYDWKPKGGFVRAALADAQIPDVKLETVGDWRVLQTEGDTDHWRIVAEGQSSRTSAELAAYMGKAFEAGHWTRVSGADEASDWRFTAGDGAPWRGSFALTPAAGPGRYTMTLTIARGT